MSRPTALFAALTLFACAAPAGALQLRFPVDNADGRAIWSVWVIGFDHDLAPGEDRTDCLNYAGLSGFPFCYDDHSGSDYLLEGGFARMDAESATIVAAADGVVVRVVDGHYDRCHGDFQSFDVTCDGHEQRSNYVAIEHEGGWRTEYHHMKRGSPIVAEGDVVACGTPLGRIGSSGYSTAPHLHFHVYDPSGVAVDPYAGPESQPTSLWVEQDGPYGLPAERCEGEPPPPDVVEPPPDVVEPARPDIAAPDVTAADGAGGDALPPDGSGPGADARAPDTDDVDRADPPPDAGAPPDALAGRDTRYDWDDIDPPGAKLPVTCAAGDGGAGPASLALLALLLGFLAFVQRRARSPRSACVAASASARSRKRRTTSASS